MTNDENKRLVQLAMRLPWRSLGADIPEFLRLVEKLAWSAAGPACGPRSVEVSADAVILSDAHAQAILRHMRRWTDGEVLLSNAELREGRSLCDVLSTARFSAGLRHAEGATLVLVHK